MRISDWSSDVCSSDLRNIIRNVAFGETLCFHDQRHFLRLLAQADFIAGLHEPRGDVALYAVYINVAVADDLASREDRRRELGAVHNGVQTAFQETDRSEEHTSELQSLMRISYAVFCFKKKTQTHT